MNTSILNTKVQDFITSNLNSDVTKLILKGSSFKSIKIQEIVEQIVSKKKCELKLPSWFNTKGIYYPNKLNIEQTSSEVTANYKAKLISGESIIDLTGGFGVDSYAFSNRFNVVTHCEINTKLSALAKHNFQQLNTNNITTIDYDGMLFLEKSKSEYDWVYVDPSRRDASKQRVFLLKDCSPNVPENIEFLFKYTNNILIKTAPLLDITAALNELKEVKEVHIIAINNDVKEVLYLLEKDFDKPIVFKTINFKKDVNQVFNFYKSTQEANYCLPKKYLYEPNVAILKSSAFNEISNHFLLSKIGKHAHLYTSEKQIIFPGRTFEIKNVLPYKTKLIKECISNNKGNITTRNFPETVAQIRKKTKIKEGGNAYLFFTTNFKNEKIVLVCEKITKNQL